jgi:phosphohistidine phosphatase SixA
MRLVPFILALLLLGGSHSTRADEAGFAAVAAGGHVVLLRHGKTPGGAGDPPGFRIDDCTTQRNLTDEGREQVRVHARLLRAHNAKIDKVLSSAWYRCRETAALLDAGEVGHLAALDNLFGRWEAREGKTRALRELVRGWKGPGTLALVTHGANVLPLVHIQPSEAEGIVVKPIPESAEGFEVVGRISPTG